MAHYAKVHNGVVEQVIVAEADFFDSFLDSSPGEWIQTSYNTVDGVHSNGETPLRKNYAGVGDTYDKGRDAFYAPQPFGSWVLDEETCQWGPPVLKPEDGLYTWDEETLQWIRYDEVTP